MRLAATRSQIDSPRLLILIAAALALAVLCIYAFGQPLAAWGIAAGLNAAGMRATFGQLHVSPSGTQARDVTLTSTTGEPIGTIGALDVRYSLRDALPGGARQYGIESASIADAHIVVIRHKDGTWNIPFPKGNANTAPSSTPLILGANVRNSSIDVYDGAQGVPAARHLIVRNINANADIATDGNTAYDASLDYVEDGTAYPVTARGHLDAVAQFGTQTITAAHLPIARIVDFAANSPSFHLLGGELERVHASIVSAPGPNATMQQHIDGSAYLAKTRMAIGGVVKPVRDLHGAVALYDNGLLLDGVQGTLAGAPVNIGGGIYDLTTPQFRLTVAAQGDLAQLKQALAQTNALPMSGQARLDVLVEGPASTPTDLIALNAPAASYNGMPLGKTSATVAFDGQEADVVSFHTTYDGLDASARGRVLLHTDHQALQVIAGLSGASQSVPYAATLLPSMPIGATVLAQGDTLAHITTEGLLFGQSASGSLDGAFAVASNGVGVAGPVLIRRGNGSLYAIASIDHPHNRFVGFVDAAQMPLAYSGNSATVNGRLVGSWDHGQLSGAGVSQLTNITSPYGTIARANVRVGQSATSPLAVALDASGIGTLGAVASAVVTYRNGTLQIPDAALSNGSTFANAHGSVANVMGSAPTYAIDANVHSADVSSLVAIAQPKQANLVEGSANARVHVGGSGAQPSVSGAVNVPEGAVNGLAFSSLDASLAGTPTAMNVSSGSVRVGSTRVAFNGAYAPGDARLAVDAPHTNLADFNDFFDAGDMLAGTGSLRANAAMRGSAIATNGSARFSNTQVRAYRLGSAVADWHTQGNAIATTVAFGSERGHVVANGTVVPGGAVNVRGTATNMDLAFWLPMAGITAPISGQASASGRVAGTFPDLDTDLDAHVRHATLNGIAVAAADARVSTRGGRGTLDAFDARLAHATLTGSGTFGLHAGDQLNLAFRGVTPNVADVVYDATGRHIDAAGALDTTLAISGTRVAPRVADSFTLTQARYGAFSVPRAVGNVVVTQDLVTLRGAEVDLERGRVLAEGSVPITLTPFAIDPRDRAIAATFTADDVEASNAAPLLPKGTKISGRIDGRVSVNGSVRQPRFGGALALSGGSFSGPAERVPITDVTAQLAFSGESVALQRAHAAVGGGRIDASGTAAVPSINDLAAVRANFTATATNARIDAPAYLKGTIDANTTLTKAPGSAAQLGGTVAFSHTRIPLTALYNPAPPDAPKVAPPNVGLNLHIVATDDVRVVSPNVDVGALGSVDVANTLADPQLDGQFVATDGTVSFYRTFTLENASVTFHRQDGVIPTVDALATTTIDNPYTNVALRVTGPATGLNISFASDPSYDRAQILGLLVNAQSLGAVNGVASSGPSTPFSASSAVTGLATGQLNTLFTRNLLEPLGDALGKTLGFSSFTVTDSFNDPTKLGINARRKFAKNLDFVFAETFGEPREQSLSLEDDPHGQATAYALTVYSSTQARALAGFSRPILVNSLDYANAATLPTTMTGNNGVDVRYERKFP